MLQIGSSLSLVQSEKHKQLHDSWRRVTTQCSSAFLGCWKGSEGPCGCFMRLSQNFSFLIGIKTGRDQETLEGSLAFTHHKSAE